MKRLLFIFCILAFVAQFSFSQKAAEQEKQVIQDELKKFEVFAKKASEHGATHVDITKNIPPALWQFDTEGDPYPAWYIYRASLLKIFPPQQMQPYVNKEYAERVAGLLEARCAILRRYGLKAYYFATEPALLPEKFFIDHPELRGARVDHPNRSRVARFAPCVDRPEVLAMYRAAMKLMLKRCPEVEIISLFTSDSGSGFCWTHGLYAGRNGNSDCEHRPMADRISGFMITLQDAARESGSEIEINLRPISPRQWMPATFHNPQQIAAKLPKGLTLAGFSDAAGEDFDRGRAGWGGEAFYPVAGLTNPLPTARRLTGRFSNAAQQNSRLIVSYDEPDVLDFNLGLYEAFKRAKPGNKVEMMQALRGYAAELAGEQGADDLLEIWLALDLISNDLEVLDFGPVLSFGPILARWINRPLVPFPSELSSDETEYYRPFLFQAKGEEQANNLIDIQAMRMFEGYGARMLAQRVYEMVMANLSKALRLAAGLQEKATDPARSAEWKNMINRLTVLRSLVQTIDNVIAYQALLDLARSRGAEPEANPVLGTAASWDRQEIQRLARNEIDNAVSLKRLIESSPVPLIHTAPIAEYETIRMLGPDLPAQLKNKIDIMNRHWLDYNRIYTVPNM